MQRIVLGAVAGLVALFLGCGPVYCAQVACDCASPINVTVQKAGGGSIANVTIEGSTVSSATCSEDPTSGKTFCFANAAPGKHAFDVKAPGFQTRHVEVTVKEGDSASCCQCVGSEPVDVSLDPV